MLTVVEPATSRRLLDLNETLGLLNLSDVRRLGGAIMDTTAIERLIDSASSAVARFCRREFGLERVTELLRSGQCRNDLVLARFPIVEVHAVVENGQTLGPADFEVDRATGLLVRLHGERPCHWPSGAISVNYSAGYDLPVGAPADLRHGCLELVKHMLAGAEHDPLLRSESTEGVGETTWFSGIGADGIPPAAREFLRPFRNVRVG